MLGPQLIAAADCSCFRTPRCRQSRHAPLDIGSTSAGPLHDHEAERDPVRAEAEEAFLAAFARNRQSPFANGKDGVFQGRHFSSLPRQVAREMTYMCLARPKMDETFRARLETADKISPGKWERSSVAMERAWADGARPRVTNDSAWRTAVSGSAFLGLLGRLGRDATRSTASRKRKSASMAAMAPGGRAYHHGDRAVRGHTACLATQLSRLRSLRA